MDIWQLKTMIDTFKKTSDLRNFTYIVNPHIAKLVGNVKGKTVLDVGCGFGRHLDIFSKQMPLKLVGCDISENQIEICKGTIENSNIEYYVLDFSSAGSSTVLGHDKYDIIYTVCVMMYMETLDKLKTFITNCYKCLKPNGKLVICTFDYATTSLHPEVFDIFKIPSKPLTKNNEYIDGCTVQMEFTGYIITTYQREFATVKQLMEEADFKNITKHDLFLDDIALEAFTLEELSIIKKSNLLLFLTAEKL